MYLHLSFKRCFFFKTPFSWFFIFKLTILRYRYVMRIMHPNVTIFHPRLFYIKLMNFLLSSLYVFQEYESNSEF